MYRKKIYAWGWRKNLTNDEVRSVLHSQGGIPAGVKVPLRMQPRRIKQYIMRSKKASQLVLHGEPTGVAVVPRARSLPLPTNPMLAGGLRETATLLFHLRNYIDSSFTNGLWVMNSEGIGSRGETMLIEAWGRFDTVIHGMSRSEDVQVLEILNPAFHAFRLVICEETPRALSFILSALLTLRRYGQNYLIGVVLGFLCRTSREVLGPNHQIPKLWQMVSALTFDHEPGLFEVVFELLVREFEPRIGAKNSLLASLFIDYYDALICSTKSAAEQERFLRQAVARVEGAEQHSPTLEAARAELQVRYRCAMRNLRIDEEDLDGAEQITLLDAPSTKLLEIWQAQSIGYVKQRSGDFLGALQFFLKAFEIAEKETRLTFSQEHWVQTILANLEDISTSLGNCVDSQRFKRIRSSRVNRLIAPTRRLDGTLLPTDIQHTHNGGQTVQGFSQPARGWDVNDAKHLDWASISRPTASNREIPPAYRTGNRLINRGS